MTDNPMAAMYDAEYFAGERSKSAYDDYTLCRGIVREMAALIDGALAPASVFDAGAAYGFTVEWWREKGIPALGCDVSEFAVSRSDGRVQLHDLLKPLPEADGSWDVVTCTECMEHIVEERVTDVVQELTRVASRATVLLIALGAGEDPGDVTHVTMRPRSWWESLFDELGIPRLQDAEGRLNDADLSKRMKWEGRWFVLGSAGGAAS